MTITGSNSRIGDSFNELYDKMLNVINKWNKTRRFVSKGHEMCAQTWKLNFGNVKSIYTLE